MIFFLYFYTPTSVFLSLKKESSCSWYRKQNYYNFIYYKKEIVVPFLWKELEMESKFYSLKDKDKDKDKNK